MSLLASRVSLVVWPQQLAAVEFRADAVANARPFGPSNDRGGTCKADVGYHPGEAGFASS